MSGHRVGRYAQDRAPIVCKTGFCYPNGSGITRRIRCIQEISSEINIIRWLRTSHRLNVRAIRDNDLSTLAFRFIVNEKFRETWGSKVRVTIIFQALHHHG